MPVEWSDDWLIGEKRIDDGNCSPTPGLNRPEIPSHGQSASLADLLVA